MGRFDLVNHKLLSTLAAIAAQKAGLGSFAALTGRDPLDAALCVATAQDRGFIDRATPPNLTATGAAWASAELEKLAPLVDATRPQRVAA